SHVVHALIGVICVGAIVRKQVVTAVDASHQIGNHSGVAFDKAPNIVPKPSIPLKPRYARKSSAELKSTRVPGLSDEPQPSQFRIARDFGEDRSVSPVKISIRIAAEDR